jgi:hypothetical protein
LIRGVDIFSLEIVETEFQLWERFNPLSDGVSLWLLFGRSGCLLGLLLLLFFLATFLLFLLLLVATLLFLFLFIVLFGFFFFDNGLEVKIW